MGTLLFSAFLLLFLSCFSILHLVHGQPQPGFISIDCGSNGSYTEPIMGINYVSDSNFASTGSIKSISSDYELTTLYKQLWNVRSFSEGIRNCYTIPVKVGKKYLIRASFLYANYDGQKSIPEFDIYFGPNFWVTVKLPQEESILHEEIIHITSSNLVQICLVNVGNGVPFISAIDLRPLPNTTYVTVSGSLTTFARFDIGAMNNTFIRFPEDVYDRVWSPYSNSKWTSISSTLLDKIDNEDPQGFKAPPKVLATASTVINESAPMEFSWSDPDASNEYYIYMYFVELQELQANQSRLFKIFVNDELFIDDNIAMGHLWENVARSRIPLANSDTYEFKLIMSEGSNLPPIINAVEIYKVMKFAQLATEERDVDAIESIKNVYGVTKNWQGDPCAPKTFAWQGLNCSYDDASNPYRITKLDLSSSGLRGEISASITNLTNLVVLDLSNNSLSGSVPDFLVDMKGLTAINLSRNNLSGLIPAALIDKRNKGFLSLSVEGNQNLQETTPNEKKKNVVGPIVGAIAGAIIIILLILAYVYFIRPKRNPKGSSLMDPHHSPINSQVELHSREQLQTPSRQVSYSDILKMTNSFGKLLGEGGFGKVYYGLMGNIEVAVKMLSPKSTQGYREFQAEVDLLLRVHHRNLTSLVGYCNEGETKMGLVYEYMGKGNLGSILLGGGREVLRWEKRLQIALDSAQGLEYLHHGCRPPIIHRDIKSSNILLNEYLEAKLADFGLSRAFPMEGGVTHVTTRVVGTPGYLDPEYYTTYKLTEKSDVYSFGIIILELISGRAVLVKTSEKSHIIQWVDSNITQGDIYSIIDPKMSEDCNTNSVWKALDIAMACTASNPINRPTMSQVVSELKECLTLIEFNQKDYYQIDQSATTVSTSFHSQMGPMAR